MSMSSNQVSIFLLMVTFACWMATEIVQAMPPSTTLDLNWQNFKVKQGRTYVAGSSEEAKRKAIFAATDAMIRAHNSDPKKTYTMAHTRFSDLTEGEMKGYTGRVVPPGFNSSAFRTVVSRVDRKALSPSVDLRSDKCMQEIRDQGSCGCCWAFGASFTLEFTACVRSCTPVTLSPQQLVDCDTSGNNNGCSGGMGFDAWRYVAKVGGQMTESSYPYTSGNTGSGGTCKFSLAKVGAKVNTANPVTMIADNDVTTMMTILDSRGVVDIGYSVASDFNAYTSGVFTGKKCGTAQQNHEMVAVGYGKDSATGLDYWIIRNQWGTGWGQGGYIYIQRGVNLCRIEELAAIVNLP